MNRSVAVAHDH